MGLMRFVVTPPERARADVLERAFMVGPEQIPWVTRVDLDEGLLTVTRSATESGSFCIPWPVRGHGEVLLSTATLMERRGAYHLTVELARGRLNQLRNQANEWQIQGLSVPDVARQFIHQALEAFARAATSQAEPQIAAAEAERSLKYALDAADVVAHRYIERALSARHRQTPKLTTILGGCLDQKLLDAAHARHFQSTFNGAVVPLTWRDIEATEGAYDWSIADQQIEWCHANNLKVVAGPVLRLDDRGMPDWLALWEGDFDNLFAFASDYVETAVHRYAGKTALWQCAARVNVGNALSLTEEQRLRLAVQAFEITRRVDPQTPAIIRFDQPWAEYMGRTDRDLSPLHFADVIIRSGLDLSGIGLELNIAYWPEGTQHRDLLDYSRQLDRWSSLGLPLWITLTVPSGNVPDSRAYGRSHPLRVADGGDWTPEAQDGWLKRFLPMLLAKPAVQGIFYSQFRDNLPHEFPHGGLIGPDGSPKPALQTLAHLRKKHLD